jgi:chorismate mutase/prephenate dehydratase
VAAIWREIMSACLALESPQRVAVLGPEGTFCEQAAIEFFGGAADLMYCANFDEVFHATAAGSAQYGVVGVENSTEGVVTRSLDCSCTPPPMWWAR